MIWKINVATFKCCHNNRNSENKDFTLVSQNGSQPKHSSRNTHSLCLCLYTELNSFILLFTFHIIFPRWATAQVSIVQ